MPTTPAAFWPLVITAGVNDALHAMVGTTKVTATLAAGTYLNPGQFGVAVASALTSAIASGWTVSVGPTGRVTISASVPFTLSASAGTNRLLWSQQFDNAAWAKRGTAAVVANGGSTAPDGTATADRISGIGALGVNDLYQGIGGFAASESVAASVWVKRVSASGTLRIANPINSALGDLMVDLAAIGTGWVRVARGVAGVTEVSPFMSDAGGACGMHFIGAAGGPLSFDLWQGQCEPGTLPGSIALTTTAPVTPVSPDPLFASLGFNDNTAPATSATSPNQHQNGWYGDRSVGFDGKAWFKRISAQGVAHSGRVKSLIFGEQEFRTIQFTNLPAHKAKIERESAATLNEALERLWRYGYARFRWFPDSSRFDIGTDYALDEAGLKEFQPTRLQSKELYSLKWDLRRYV